MSQSPGQRVAHKICERSTPGSILAFQTIVSRTIQGTGIAAAVALAAVLICLPLTAAAQAAQAAKDQAKPETQDGTSRLRIEVTGGDQNKPVADASVYVKFAEERKLLKDKKIELNLKTNQEGVARSPEIPQGRVLIQVVAPGWKTHGEWYDINQSEQTIQIHIARPTTNWY